MSTSKQQGPIPLRSSLNLMIRLLHSSVPMSFRSPSTRPSTSLEALQSRPRKGPPPPFNLGGGGNRDQSQIMVELRLEKCNLFQVYTNEIQKHHHLVEIRPVRCRQLKDLAGAIITRGHLQPPLPPPPPPINQSSNRSNEKTHLSHQPTQKLINAPSHSTSLYYVHLFFPSSNGGFEIEGFSPWIGDSDCFFGIHGFGRTKWGRRQYWGDGGSLQCGSLHVYPSAVQ